jgi:hypothetical protein
MPEKMPLMPVYDFKHFRKDRETGKTIGKPAKLTIYTEAGEIEGGFPQKGSITLSLDNGKEGKDKDGKEQHQYVMFKCEIQEAIELRDVLDMLIKGHIKAHSERVMKAHEEYQKRKQSQEG